MGRFRNCATDKEVWSGRKESCEVKVRTQFTMVMDKLADEVRRGSPWTVTFVAVPVICWKADGGIFGRR